MCVALQVVFGSLYRDDVLIKPSRVVSILAAACMLQLVSHQLSLKVGYGICETPADFENTQLKWSYPLSFIADSDSTHSKYLDEQSCTSANTDARERARLAYVFVKQHGE